MISTHPQHSFTTGARVTVINATVSGRFCIEGEATIVSKADTAERYFVRFDGDHGTVERLVDPDAQRDPRAYVDRLNAYYFFPRGAMA